MAFKMVNFSDFKESNIAYKPFIYYAKSQIEKARGLNKKIVNPICQLPTS